jgi:hypothetical protein
MNNLTERETCVLLWLQERFRRAVILRVVVPGRVRVLGWHPNTLRPVRCRHERRGEDEVRQELRPVVFRLPPWG